MIEAVSAVSVRLGGSSRGLELQVFGREVPRSRDFEDGNWLRVRVRVATGTMSADMTGESLRSEEFVRFATALRRMADLVAGEATLETLEGWFELRVRCAPNGELSVDGSLSDEIGIGNRLMFSLPGLDQTHLGPFLDGVNEVVDRYPVVGSR